MTKDKGEKILKEDDEEEEMKKTIKTQQTNVLT